MSLRRILLFATNLVPLIFLALMISCARPLGPSYTIEKQTLALRFIPQPQSLLDVQAHFRVLASGTHPLPAIDILLPDEKTFSLQDLQITADGHDVSSAPLKEAPSHTVRIQFDSPLPPGRQQNLFVHYTLPAPSRIDSAMASAAFVAGGDWYPALLSPKGMFAKLFVEFKKWDLEIRVPHDFLVHSSGRLRHSRKENSETILRVQHEFDDRPFIVAGRYQQQVVRPPLAQQPSPRQEPAGRRGLAAKHQKDQITFWTFHPLDPEAARQAGSQVAQLTLAYERLFGLSAGNPKTIWVVECRFAALRSETSQNQNAGERPATSCDTALPDTLFIEPLRADGIAAQPFQHNINHALARLWLSHATSTPQDGFALDGIYDYASRAVLLQNKDAKQRHDSIASLLSEYDKKSRQQDISPSKPSAPQNGPLLIEARNGKSVLFFFALEDQYGPQPLHRAIARAVHARGAQGYNPNDLRAALEGETQKKAADFFHRWLDRPGIPEDFRAGYENNHENNSDAAAKLDKETKQ